MSEAELLEPTNDYVFHRVFGDEENPVPLIGLLNDLMMPKDPIREVDIAKRDLESDVQGGKYIVLDVKARTEHHGVIDLEMQCRKIQGLSERITQYTDTLDSRHLNAGQKYPDRPSTTSIWIFNFINDPRLPSAINEVYPTYQPNGLTSDYTIFTRDKLLITVELPKRDAIPPEYHVDRVGTWFDFITTPRAVSEDNLFFKEVQEAMKNLHRVSQNQRDRDLAAIRDANLQLYDGLLHDREQKGRTDKATEIAKELIADGYRDVSKLVKITKLSQKQIESLL